MGIYSISPGKETAKGFMKKLAGKEQSTSTPSCGRPGVWDARMPVLMAVPELAAWLEGDSRC